MSYADYRDLVVWQKSMLLAKKVYQQISLLPSDEKYALADQMKRAAISIPSNIAEGEARKSKKEFIQFLSFANGSRAELETQLLLCCEIGYLTRYQIEELMMMCEEISKMIYALIKKLRSAPLH